MFATEQYLFDKNMLSMKKLHDFLIDCENYNNNNNN